MKCDQNFARYLGESVLNKLHLSGSLRDHHADRLDTGARQEGAQISMLPRNGQLRNACRNLMCGGVPPNI